MAILETNKTMGICGSNAMVLMQYHPSSISSTETSGVQSINGISNVITYIPQNNNTMKSISITAYFTAFTQEDLTDLNVYANAGAAGVGSALAVGASMLGSKAQTIYTKGLQIIGLGAGAYDIISGLIAKKGILSDKFFIGENNMNKLKKLCEMMRTSEDISITWDIDNETSKETSYIIKSINYTVEELNDNNGNTTQLKVDIGFIQSGIRVNI